jgi:hypothetical protein
MTVVLMWVAATACGSDRPEIAKWRSAWSERPVVPDIAQLEPQAARTLCGQLLSDAHDAPKRLLPTPDPELDDAVREWILRVENLGFECSTTPEEISDFASRRAEIQILEAEVAAAVAVASDRERPSS